MTASTKAQNKILPLYYDENKSLEDIAKITGYSKATVYNNIYAFKQSGKTWLDNRIELLREIRALASAKNKTIEQICLIKNVSLNQYEYWVKLSKQN